MKSKSRSITAENNMSGAKFKQTMKSLRKTNIVKNWIEKFTNVGKSCSAVTERRRCSESQIG